MEVGSGSSVGARTGPDFKPHRWQKFKRNNIFIIPAVFM
jgi:hypothetical protein